MLIGTNRYRDELSKTELRSSLESNVANQDMQSQSQDSLSLISRFVHVSISSTPPNVLVTPLQKNFNLIRHSRIVNIIFLSVGTMT